ncbi:hypothetical protein C8D92_10533 [Tamilnaduibacter salinus]|uniref:Uncharacterized protein n=1 Tax=Tamilnaduibacter salinus TaxID=1484056 RepID=A0A2A2I2L8_9GAMM|nr:hypothetical protein [Tamilnaduibacter salinus]PAV25959.1 hypothetical protein CF392_08280 [Tamilnaduibacter salinus]PVY76280.1 hypothetical protein C8D92_10533 [Tamilnaduibacter salinus]
MKLHYFHGRSPLRHLVLSREDWRIELHVKPVGDNIWALVALSGARDSQPQRRKCQGPYHSAGQAEAALRGVAGSLVGDAFEPRPGAHAVWSVQAQREARTIRQERAESAGDYAFDPDQHEPLF